MNTQTKNDWTMREQEIDYLIVQTILCDYIPVHAEEKSKIDVSRKKKVQKDRIECVSGRSGFLKINHSYRS